MNEPDEDSMDTRLRELFETIDPPIDDAVFVARVMRRIEYRVIVRRSVLAAAVLLGAAVAGAPAAELAANLGAWFASRADAASDVAGLSLAASAAMSLAALSLGGYHWLTR